MQEQVLEPCVSVTFKVWREEDPTMCAENQQPIPQGESQESMISTSTREETF